MIANFVFWYEDVGAFLMLMCIPIGVKLIGLSVEVWLHETVLVHTNNAINSQVVLLHLLHSLLFSSLLLYIHTHSSNQIKPYCSHSESTQILFDRLWSFALRLFLEESGIWI
ncbi:hypothetical protein RJT34_32216 [Clitoria ternatea]|uniref:Uncharacterized protein n=1 Tax=Clitoria ternatea TaxID=43366 RepID=A0AAN9I3J8_CLITE